MRSQPKLQVVVIDSEPDNCAIPWPDLRLGAGIELRVFADQESAAIDLSLATEEVILLVDGLNAAIIEQRLIALHSKFGHKFPIVVCHHGDDMQQYQRFIQLGAQDCVSRSEILNQQFPRILFRALERQRRQNELQQAALSDALTGLPNRTAMVNDLNSRLESTTKSKSFALLFLDIDDFKFVNDAHGHEIGDRFLLEFVRRVRSCLSEDDQLARFGGDEFVVLLDGVTDNQKVESFVELMQASLREPLILDDNEIFIAVSIGVVAANEEHNDPSQLIREADTAMFAAKTRGKSRFAWFDDNMRDEALTRLTFERALWRAAELGELQILFQPQVNIQTSVPCGFEALIRWQHNGELVSPLKFIPVAERTGAIHSIGLWVLDAACRQLKEWSTLYPDLGVSVNVSPVQLERLSFAGKVLETIKSYDIAPNRITIEITESDAIKDFDCVVKMLAALKTAGVRVSVDDFGTGHSSLSQLHKLPLNEVKIDRSFIKNIEDGDDYSRLFVETIHMLAGGIGLDLVAEGIETEGQRNVLLDCQYRIGQGYLFSPPITAPQATLMLEEFCTAPSGTQLFLPVGHVAEPQSLTFP